MSDKSKEFEDLPTEQPEQLSLLKLNDYSKDTIAIASVHNYLIQHFDFRYNSIAMEVEFKRKDDKYYKFFDDPAYRDLDQEVTLKCAKIDERYLKNWIFGSQITKTYDPIKEYLFSLKNWDGNTDWIKYFLQQIHLDNEEDREIFVWAFRKWIVAMVASLVEETVVNQTCIVLVGAQGRYKTTFLNSLVPEKFRLDYLYSSTFIAHNKDHEKYLFTKWLINLDEMQAFNRSDIESIKSKISQDRIAIRLPYAKADTKAWRKASFCGSVNKDKFLNDATGTRRFLPFKIDDIRLDPDLDIGLIYAQALNLYKTGFKFYFDRDDIEQLEKHNERYKDKQFEEEHLLKHFQLPTKQQLETKKGIEYMTATDIMEWLYKKYENYNKNNTVRRNIGITLQAHGFHQVSKRLNGNPVQVYIVVRVENPTMTNADGSIMEENIPENYI